MGKLLHLSVSQFSHLLTEDYDLFLSFRDSVRIKSVSTRKCLRKVPDT